MRCEGAMAYELARQLEASSLWRPWLGDHGYAELRQHLSSPAAWASLMRPSDSSSPARLRLQLRVRALLYDKGLECIISPSAAPAPSQLNLQLQPDSVYFSLEQDALDWARLQAERPPWLALLQARFGLEPRDTMMVSSLHIPVADNNKARSHQQQHQAQQRRILSSTPKLGRNHGAFRSAEQHKSFGRTPVNCRNATADMDGEKGVDDLWYDQWLEKRLVERMNCLARRFAQQKLPFPEQDAFRRTPEGMAAFVSVSTRARARRQLDGTLFKPDKDETVVFSDEDLAILPEALLPNCVPDNPRPGRSTHERAILYCDEQSSVTSSVLLPGVSSYGFHNQAAGGTRPKLVKEEADTVARQTLAKLLESFGFEGAKQTSVDILSDLMICHIRSLGSRLKMLLDSYQKHSSTDEILKMFLHCAGGSFSNLRSLAEYVKNEKSQVESSSSMQSQQMALHSQNLAYQRKRPTSSVRVNKRFDGRGGGVEFPSAIDMKPFASQLSKQPWMGQQMYHSNSPQVLQQLKQNLQLQPTTGMSSLPKGRMEGLQELLGSEVIKQEVSDDIDGTLGSPNRKKRKME